MYAGNKLSVGLRKKLLLFRFSVNIFNSRCISIVSNWETESPFTSIILRNKDKKSTDKSRNRTNNNLASFVFNMELRNVHISTPYPFLSICVSSSLKCWKKYSILYIISFMRK